MVGVFFITHALRVSYAIALKAFAVLTSTYIVVLEGVLYAYVYFTSHGDPMTWIVTLYVTWLYRGA